MVLLPLIGGLISCEAPYIIVIIFGWYFSHLRVLEKDSLEPLSKKVIMVTLPVYYFLLIGRSNSVYNLSNYYIIIISDLLKTAVSFSFSYGYAISSKMDSRYKYSWIVIISQSMVNSFCYHLSIKSKEETHYCKEPGPNSCIHLFFNQILVWYVMFNLIRRDKEYSVAIKEVWEDVAIRASERHDDHVRKENTKENESEKEKEPSSSEMALQFQAHEGREGIGLVATPSFSAKAKNYYDKKLKKGDKTEFQKIAYTLFQPSIIAICSGFILGFIPSVKNWWFDTKTAVFVYNLFTPDVSGHYKYYCFLILGINLFLNEKGHDQVRFTKIEYMVHFAIKLVFLPFSGIIFLSVARKFFENRALLFSAYIQWCLPTSQDIMMICQSKKISSFSISLCILSQYFYLTFINYFLVTPPILKILDME